MTEFGPDDEIDRGHMVPLYRQLAEIIKARIERGDWQPGRAIPSVAQLMAEYELGRDTVRHAVRALEEEGVVVTVPGRGTYVKPPPTTGRRGRR